ncbi:MAG: hypothetical protein WC683_15020 [bacterium]
MTPNEITILSIVAMGCILIAAFGYAAGYLAGNSDGIQAKQNERPEWIDDGCKYKCWNESISCETLHDVCDPYFDPRFCTRCAP